MELNCYEVESWTRFSAQLKTNYFMQKFLLRCSSNYKELFWSDSRRTLELKHYLCLGTISQNKIIIVCSKIVFFSHIASWIYHQLTWTSLRWISINIPTERLILKMFELLGLKINWKSMFHSFKSMFIFISWIVSKVYHQLIYKFILTGFIVNIRA